MLLFMKSEVRRPYYSTRTVVLDGDVRLRPSNFGTAALVLLHLVYLAMTADHIREERARTCCVVVHMSCKIQYFLTETNREWFGIANTTGDGERDGTPCSHEEFSSFYPHRWYPYRTVYVWNLYDLWSVELRQNTTVGSSNGNELLEIHTTRLFVNGFKL